MKSRIGIVVLVLVCLGLVIALITIRKQASDQQQADSAQIVKFSNDLATTAVKLTDQTRVAEELEKDRVAQKKSLEELTNQVSQSQASLAEKTTALAKTETALKATQEEVTKRDAKITELENQNQSLDRQAQELSTAITNLTVQIADTQKRLASSEGDRTFLEKELKRLTAEKAELERQFNDVKIVRAQLAKLKEEMNVSRRLEWIRTGLMASSDEKGATRLMKGGTTPAAQKSSKPAYDLNVEVSADGSVRVIPPLKPGATNAPTAK